MRLFRQASPGDWDGVFARMAAALAERFVAAPDTTPRRGPIPVAIAPGELLDKITILEIKAARIDDPAKLAHVRNELAALVAARDRALAADELEPLAGLIAELRAANAALWDAEDALRRCERDGDFGADFVALARSVYRTNDQRAALKRQINELLGSELFEEKHYASEAQPDAEGLSGIARGGIHPPDG
jgi:hypothetical protein